MPPKQIGQRKEGVSDSIASATATATRRRNSSGASDQAGAAYLEQPSVIRFIDDLVKKCMAAQPQDPSLFVYEMLKKKHEGQGGSPTTPGKIAPVPPSQPKPESTRQGSSIGGVASDQNDPAWPANCLLEYVNKSLGTLAGTKHDTKPSLGPMERLPPHPLKAEIERSLTVVASSWDKDKQLSRETAVASTPKKHSSASRSATLKSQMAEALFEATQLLNSTTSMDLEAVMLAVVSSVKNLLKADRCSVFLAHEERKVLTSTIEGKTFSLRYGQGIAGHVARTMCSVLIPNAYEDPRFDPQVDLELGYTTRDILCLPVALDGKLVAVVQLVNKLGGSTFNADDESLFVSFAQFAGVRLRNAVLYEEQRRLALRNKMISEVTEALANTELVETRLIPVIIKHAKDIVGADRCAFFAFESESPSIIAHLEGVQEQLVLPSNSGVVGWVAHHKRLLNVTDAYKDQRFNQDVDAISGYKTKNILCIPIFVDKKIVAVSQLLNKVVNGEVVPFTEEDEDVLTAFANVAGVCIRNCRLLQAVEERKRIVEATLQVARTISHSDITKPETMMGHVSTSICSCTGAEFCGLFMLTNDYSQLTTTVGKGSSAMLPSITDTFLDGRVQHREGESRSVVISVPYTKPNIISNVCRSKTVARHRDLTPEMCGGVFGSKFVARDAVLVPVVVGEEGVGVLTLLNKGSEGYFSDNDVELVELLAVFVAFSIRNSKLFMAAQCQVDDIASLRQLERFVTEDDPSSGITEVDENDLMNRRLSPGLNRDSTTPTGILSTATANAMMSGSLEVIPMERVDEAMALDVDLEMKKDLSTPKFNIHLYKDELIDSAQLIALGVEMFRRWDLLNRCSIQEETLYRFLLMVKSKYRLVPYHNFFHAFDVTQTIFSMVNASGLDRALPATDLLALLLAGFVHDVDHMGLNNAFHLKAETPMGILTSLTGAKSVLEVHHCQLAIEILTRTGLLAEMSHNLRSVVYRGIIDSVLATDMALHKDICTQLETELHPFLKALWPTGEPTPYDLMAAEAPERSPGGSLRISLSAGGTPAGGFPPEKRRLLMIMLLKMADISNVSKAFDCSRKWGISVMEEFYAQGDQERKTGLEVTPMFDRKCKAELAKGQAGFINFVAKPFFLITVKCLPKLQYLVDGIDNNLRTWERVLEQQALVASMSVEDDDDEPEEDGGDIPDMKDDR